MKTILAFIFFFAVYSAANAQSVENANPEGSYAIIHDPDGFVNVRKEKSIKSTVEGKIYKDDIFTCFPDKSDWWKVVRIEDDKGNSTNWLEGYVHKSRITLLRNWKSVSKKNI